LCACFVGSAAVVEYEKAIFSQGIFVFIKLLCYNRCYMVELNPDIILAEGERIEPNKGEATDVLLIRAIVRAKETGKSVNVI